jgi:hypothetical protein
MSSSKELESLPAEIHRRHPTNGVDLDIEADGNGGGIDSIDLQDSDEAALARLGYKSEMIREFGK